MSASLGKFILAKIALAPVTTPNVTGNDAVSVELGIKFSSSVAGTITGLRFYRATNETVTNTAHLWSSNGQSLATGTFPSGAGWQTILFSSPVAITAGTTYVASYHTTQYVWNASYFTAALTVGPLTAPANAGVYRYGTTSSFPSSSWQGANYWVDVLFTPAQ